MPNCYWYYVCFGHLAIAILPSEIRLLWQYFYDFSWTPPYENMQLHKKATSSTCSHTVFKSSSTVLQALTRALFFAGKITSSKIPSVLERTHAPLKRIGYRCKRNCKKSTNKYSSGLNSSPAIFSSAVALWKPSSFGYLWQAALALRLLIQPAYY